MSTTLPSRMARISLYANLLRASRAFASYNFRTYFLRDTRMKFRLAAAQSDPAAIQSSYDDFAAQLKVLKRAAIVNRLFEGPKLVVERTKVIVGGGGAGMEAGTGGAGQPV